MDLVVSQSGAGWQADFGERSWPCAVGKGGVRHDKAEGDGATPVGPSPDPKEGYPGPEGAMLATLSGDAVYGEGLNRIPTTPQPDWSLGEHLNGVCETGSL